MKRVLRGATLPLIGALVLLPGAGATASHVSGTQTFRVNVDRTPEGRTWTSSRTFRTRSRCMPGDSVVFDWAGNGEPHTVTLGTLADSAVAAFNRLTPAQKQANTPPPGFAAIDATVAEPVPGGAGRRDPVGVESVLPADAGRSDDVCPNSQHEQPAFDGTSGLLQQRLARLGPEVDDASLGRAPRPARTGSCARCTARRCRGRSPSSRRARRS